ncbi:hypothetical protein E3J59_05615 [Candidatus Aerophobetes bacterium]|uniref:DOD-type homing endonuclease domain-containing protein n=1 Tax=Aerophobetes bacterium TaxID=2030807 RepID=A0A523UP11_UNCAE|nr:MAG: hypothetical protein E3J59_05615 [Candidatus Aerophobetes bacterium]
MPSLKELSKKEERLSRGHRLCPGCGASVIVRQILLAAEDSVVLSCATGCLEVATTIYPYTAWRTPFIHCAFENSSATLSGTETAYRSLKRQGKIDKTIKFIAFGGDGGTYDIGLQALSGVLERGHNLLYVCYDNQAYMNCLSTSSLIMTKDGLKKITEIKEGDEIYAFDQKIHGLVLKKCSGVFNNGTKDVYEVTTLHHSIKATANHPFLILKRNGRGKENNLVWKTISEMKTGDEIVVLKNLDERKSFKFDFDKVKKGDYKVNRLNEINLPEYSSPDLMKYLGMYVGDGWTRNGKGEVGFALPQNSKARETLTGLHSKIFGGKVRTDEVYVYTNSVNLARFIDSLNFGSGAKNKTIPSWVFTLPKEEKESFVQGLMLSDGYKIDNSLRYVSASYELLRRLRLLLQTMGLRVGKIHEQRKEKGTKCVDRELLKDSEYGYICFSERNKWNTEKYPDQYRYKNFLMDNEYFEMEKVRNIKLVGQEPTLDLRVEGEHNFIADGIVVHNTGIQRSSASPCGAATTTSPVGKVITEGKQEERKDLTEIVVAHGTPYVAQASPAFYNDLMKKVQKALSTEGPSFMNILSPCPRGWRHLDSESIEIARLAVFTGVWPLYEVENGQYRITYRPRKKRKPLMDWIKSQGRFKHLLREENKVIVERLERSVRQREERILALAGEKAEAL